MQALRQGILIIVALAISMLFLAGPMKLMELFVEPDLLILLVDHNVVKTVITLVTALVFYMLLQNPWVDRWYYRDGGNPRLVRKLEKYSP